MDSHLLQLQRLCPDASDRLFDRCPRRDVITIQFRSGILGSGESFTVYFPIVCQRQLFQRDER
jgi:hypothetical protein